MTAWPCASIRFSNVETLSSLFAGRSRFVPGSFPVVFLIPKGLLHKLFAQSKRNCRREQFDAAFAQFHSLINHFKSQLLVGQP